MVLMKNKVFCENYSKYVVVEVEGKVVMLLHDFVVVALEVDVVVEENVAKGVAPKQEKRKMMKMKMKEKGLAHSQQEFDVHLVLHVLQQAGAREENVLAMDS